MTGYETTYGPIADMYASKYQIPPDIFRDAIRRSSNFDPNYKGQYGSGIANFKVTGVKGVDPFNVGQSLDMAAQFIKQTYADTNDWQKAASLYSDGGTPDNNMVDQIEGTSGYDTNAALSSSGKYIWQYSAEEIKALIAKYAYGFLIGIIGGVFIVGSIWVLIESNKS